VACKVTDNLARAHWEKLVWNIPFNGLGVAGAVGFDAVINGQLNQSTSLGQCLATDTLLGDAKWAGLVRDLMLEVTATAHALGLDVPDGLADKQIERTRTMGSYRASTLLDFERGQPLELQNLFLEPLRQAQAAHVPVPRLAALCRVLSDLSRRPTPGSGAAP
jgi:2-dehydropantoate 2-reductase